MRNPPRSPAAATGAGLLVRREPALRSASPRCASAFGLLARRGLLLLLGLLLLGSSGCDSGGSSRKRIRIDVFPLGFFPVVLPGGPSADVDFTADGDLLAVAGSDAIFVVSRDDGSVETTDLSGFPDCAGAELVSVLDTERGIFAGTSDGRLLEVRRSGSCSERADLGDDPLSGLAETPRRSDIAREGDLIAAAGAAGVFVVDPISAAFAALTPASSDVYTDVAFLEDTALFALDVAGDRVVSIDPDRDPVVEELVAGIGDGVGLAVNEVDGELYVADAEMGVLRSFSLVTEGAPLVDLAPYPYDAAATSGIALDGTGTLVFAVPGSAVLRGVRIPALGPVGIGQFLNGPNSGFGDLEFDGNGDMLLTANEIEDPEAVPPEPAENFLFRLDRLGNPEQIERGVGGDEFLLGLAFDSASGAIYLGSDLGNLYLRDESGSIELLVSVAPPSPLLGVELAPAASEFAGQVLVTSEDGRVIAVDPDSLVQTLIDMPAGADEPLSDLAFASDGTLYVIADNLGGGDGAVYERPDGGAFALLAGGPAMGFLGGLAVDEGGERLFIVSEDGAGDVLLEVSFAGDVRVLAGIDIDDGSFPAGIVYDGLGRVGVRATNAGAAVDVLVAPLPEP